MLLKEDVVMRMMDFAPFAWSSVGFDQLDDMLEKRDPIRILETIRVDLGSMPLSL